MQVILTTALELGIILTDPVNEVFVSLFRIRYFIFNDVLNPQTLILPEVPAVYFGIIIFGVESSAKVAIKDP